MANVDFLWLELIREPTIKSKNQLFSQNFVTSTSYERTHSNEIAVIKGAGQGALSLNIAHWHTSTPCTVSGLSKALKLLTPSENKLSKSRRKRYTSPVMKHLPSTNISECHKEAVV